MANLQSVKDLQNVEPRPNTGPGGEALSKDIEIISDYINPEGSLLLLKGTAAERRIFINSFADFFWGWPIPIFGGTTDEKSFFGHKFDRFDFAKFLDSNGGTSTADIDLLEERNVVIKAASELNILDRFYAYMFLEEVEDLVHLFNFQGDGNATQARTDFPFEADAVIAFDKDDGSSNSPQFRAKGMPTDVSKDMGGGAHRTDGIKSIDANGITVGTRLNANGNNILGVALKSGARGGMRIDISTRLGNGVQEVKDKGFNFNVFFTVDRDNADEIHLRSEGMRRQQSIKFGSSNCLLASTGQLRTIVKNGIEMGTDSDVNADTVNYIDVAIRIPLDIRTEQ